MLTTKDIDLLKSVFATKEDYSLLTQAVKSLGDRIDRLERKMDRFEQTLEMIKDHLFNLDDEFFIHSKRIRRLEENLQVLPAS